MRRDFCLVRVEFWPVAESGLIAEGTGCIHEWVQAVLEEVCMGQGGGNKWVWVDSIRVVGKGSEGVPTSSTAFSSAAFAARACSAAA